MSEDKKNKTNRRYFALDDTIRSLELEDEKKALEKANLRSSEVEREIERKLSAKKVQSQGNIQNHDNKE